VTGSQTEIAFSPFADLVTTGTDLGRNGSYDGNDDAIALVSEIRPDASGHIGVKVAPDGSSHAYLNLMELWESGGATRHGTIELRSDSIVYLSPSGEEIVAPGGGDRSQLV
jgi:hypothetical protein